VLLYGYVPHKAGSFLKFDLVGKFKAHHSEPGCMPGTAVGP
jgi:hypothetical protein